MKNAFTLLLAGLLMGCGTMAHAQDDSLDQTPTTSDTQAYLGMGVEPLHPALTNHLPDVIGKGRGVLVEEVVKNSPAEQAGLKQYDVLVRFNDQELYSPEQLVKVVRNSTPGSQVVISYVRHGKIQDVKVTLGETPRRESAGSRRAFRFPFGDRFDWSRALPDAQSPLAPKTSWETFRSMTLSKQEDGTYELKLDYHDGSDNQIHRQYTGTREEVKQAIEEDTELPKDQREHLLRSLDKQDTAQYPQFGFPWTEAWRGEMFNWPNLDF